MCSDWLQILVLHRNFLNNLTYSFSRISDSSLTLHVRVCIRIPDKFGNSSVESCLRLILVKVEGDTELVPLPQDVHVGEGVVEREMMNVLDLNLQEILTIMSQSET